jgi:spore coat polysaccharide biosynthesis protein SpsF (cytidylyltransferase family)
VKAVAIIQARMGSKRLPGKVLEELGSHPVLEWVVRAARLTPGIDEVVVATSNEAVDDAIDEWCNSNGVKCHRGPEEDVLARFAEAAKVTGADIVMRLTACWLYSIQRKPITQTTLTPPTGPTASIARSFPPRRFLKPIRKQLGRSSANT